MDVPTLRRVWQQEVVLPGPATHQEFRRERHPISPLGGARATLPGAEMQFAGPSRASSRECQESPARVGMDVSLSCPQSVCLDAVLAGPALQETSEQPDGSCGEGGTWRPKVPPGLCQGPKQTNQRAGEKEKPHGNESYPWLKAFGLKQAGWEAFSSFLHICMCVCVYLCLCVSVCVYVCVSVYACVCLCECVCMYVCISLYVVCMLCVVCVFV